MSGTDWIAPTILAAGALVLVLAAWACWQNGRSLRRAETAAERRMWGLVAWAQLHALKEQQRGAATPAPATGADPVPVCFYPIAEPWGTLARPRSSPAWMYCTDRTAPKET